MRSSAGWVIRCQRSEEDAVNLAAAMSTEEQRASLADLQNRVPNSRSSSGV
jgi:hypothetical protein